MLISLSRAGNLRAVEVDMVSLRATTGAEDTGDDNANEDDIDDAEITVCNGTPGATCTSRSSLTAVVGANVLVTSTLGIATAADATFSHLMACAVRSAARLTIVATATAVSGGGTNEEVVVAAVGWAGSWPC